MKHFIQMQFANGNLRRIASGIVSSVVKIRLCAKIPAVQCDFVPEGGSMATGKLLTRAVHQELQDLNQFRVRGSPAQELRTLLDEAAYHCGACTGFRSVLSEEVFQRLFRAPKS
jgi:hypothetical protein